MLAEPKILPRDIEPRPNHILTAHKLPPIESEQTILSDTWEAPPTFGGTWGAFFKIFEGKENGLSRTDLFNICPGNPDIFPHVFQYIIKEAIEDGLLISREVNVESVIETKNGLAVSRENSERLFLNDRSEKLRELMQDEHKIDSAKIESFQSIDFDKIAKSLNCEVKSPRDYALRLLSALPDLGEAGIIFLTHCYKCNAISPNPESCFSPEIREFLDKVIETAVAEGILIEEDIQGRPGYKLPPQIREACRQIKHFNP